MLEVGGWDGEAGEDRVRRRSSAEWWGTAKEQPRLARVVFLGGRTLQMLKDAAAGSILRI